MVAFRGASRSTALAPPCLDNKKASEIFLEIDTPHPPTRSPLTVALSSPKLLASCQRGRLNPRRPCWITRASQASKPLITNNISERYGILRGVVLGVYIPAAVSQEPDPTALEIAARVREDRPGERDAGRSSLDIDASKPSRMSAPGRGRRI